MNVVEMEFIVPARDSEIEYIVYELKEVRYAISLEIRLFSFILLQKIVIFLLLIDNTQDDGLKVFKTYSHVKFA